MTRNASFSCTTRTHTGRWSLAAMAGFVLAAGAFVSIQPAAATEARGDYCLSSDSYMDCGFTSLAQCQATASGGLGECNMAAAPAMERSRSAFDRMAMR